MTNPHDEPKLEPEQVSTPAVKALVGLGLLFIIGILVLIGIYVAEFLGAAGEGVKEGWKDISDMRTADAELTQAQREAGEAYKENVVIDIRAAAVSEQDGRKKANIVGTLRNTGRATLIKVHVKAGFLDGPDGKPVDTRTLKVFDATPLSVTTDAPIMGEGSREFLIPVDSIPETWDGQSISYGLELVRIELDEAQDDKAPPQ